MKHATGMAGERRETRPAILVTANSFWNITNFRASLVDRLVAEGFRVIVAAPGAEPGWADDHRAEAVDLAVDRSGLNPWHDATTLYQYLRLLRERRPLCLLGFTAKPNIYGSIAAGQLGIATIPNVSGLGTAFIRGGPLGSFLSLLYRVAFRKCPAVMFQNSEDRRLFIERGIVDEGQARLLPGSGIDLDRFQPTPVPAGPPVFMLVGRLLGDKGVREFAGAARMLKPDHPEWRFQLLGAIDDGNRSAISRAELQAWIDDGFIEHLGQVDDVRPFIRDATAVVLPSYREGLPRSLLEAAAMGRPMIATDVPGNRQLVRPGENGVLCAVKDSAALAGAMKQLGSLSKTDLDAMGKAGRALVEAEFGEDRVIEAYLGALHEVHAAARSAP